MEDKKGYICYNYFVGLCNRLNVLIGDMRLADKYYHKKMYLHWTRLKFDFGDIFDASELGIEMINVKHILQDEYIMSNKCDTKGIVTCFVSTKDDFINMNMSDYNMYLLSESYSDTPKYMIDEYLPYINKIKPSAELQIKIDEFSKLFNEHTVSVHVRRGDFTLNEKRNKNTDDKYFKVMDDLLKINDKTTFFVSSDDQKTQELFRQKYGDIIFTYNHGYYQSNKLGENQDDEKNALISLMLLSKNNILIATYKSTYSQMAWWLGKCKATVYVIR